MIESEPCGVRSSINRQSRTSFLCLLDRCAQDFRCCDQPQFAARRVMFRLSPLPGVARTGFGLPRPRAVSRNCALARTRTQNCEDGFERYVVVQRAQRGVNRHHPSHLSQHRAFKHLLDRGQRALYVAPCGRHARLEQRRFRDATTAREFLQARVYARCERFSLHRSSAPRGRLLQPEQRATVRGKEIEPTGKRVRSRRRIVCGKVGVASADERIQLTRILTSRADNGTRVPSRISA